MQPFSDRAKRLILSSEGNEPPSHKPPGASGCTIGFGYDLGYVTMNDFIADWQGRIPDATLKRLKPAIGVNGDAAIPIARTLAGITIPEAVALAVFTERSLPRYYEETLKAFPRFDELPPDAQGALVSLVYNRGGGMKDSTTSGVPEDRREMRAIRRAILSDTLSTEETLREIAKQLLWMRRIWAGKKMGGLITRRQNEAALVLSAIPKAP